MKFFKLNVLNLILAVLWFGISIFFFAEHFWGLGLFPLYLPVLFLLLSAGFLLVYIYFRKLKADMERKK